ncbi:MAG: hypothetical protein K2I87_04480 [Bacteroidales bacterium]|nr:hypothetical protein [Bacteroidales bacterium]
MKAIKLIVLAGFSLVALYGCIASKEWRSLTTIDKQMIPYEMGDTIRFIDEKGALSLLTVDRDITYEEQYLDFSMEMLYEVRNVRLSSERGDLSFVLDVAAWRRWNNHRPHIYIDMGKDKAKFEIYYDSKGNIGNYDSLEINNHTYYDVAVAESWRGVKLYYNKTYGILQVTQNEKNIFTLVP